MSKQIKISVTFESVEEKQSALELVPENVSVSDFIRKKAFKLPHRNSKGGAPKGNKNNPHGRQKNRQSNYD